MSTQKKGAVAPERFGRCSTTLQLSREDSIGTADDNAPKERLVLEARATYDANGLSGFMPADNLGVSKARQSLLKQSQFEGEKGGTEHECFDEENSLRNPGVDSYVVTGQGPPGGDDNLSNCESGKRVRRISRSEAATERAVCL